MKPDTKLSTPIQDLRFVQFGSREHRYFLDKGFVMIQNMDRSQLPKSLPGDHIIMTKGAL